MYVLCMILYIILNNAIHRGKTKSAIQMVRKTKVQVFNASCVTFFKFEIDAAGNRSMAILYTTV